MKPSVPEISLIKRIFWDYAIDPEEILAVLLGEKKQAGKFDRRRILIRMCERLGWYDLLNMVGLEFLREHLDKKVVEGIRFPEIRERYRYARKLLSGKTVPPTGWSAENRQRIKHTLLSNRWYRSL